MWFWFNSLKNPNNSVNYRLHFQHGNIFSPESTEVGFWDSQGRSWENQQSFQWGSSCACRFNVKEGRQVWALAVHVYPVLK